VTNSLGLAREVLELAVSKGIWVVTAESLTAGAISAQLAAVPGASRALLGGMVTYQDDLKSNLLSVPSDIIRSQSAVSATVAELMAQGARSQFVPATKHPEEDVLSVSATGIAGPDAVPPFAAGTVFIGISSRIGNRNLRMQFSGDRNRVRQLSVRAALAALREELRKL
jgi:nicotinamide-nucleotide amidase